jgi:hypothetical protein
LQPVIKDPIEEIPIDKFAQISIEEATEKDIVYDKTKVMSIPIAVIEVPDDDQTAIKEKVSIDHFEVWFLW